MVVDLAADLLSGRERGIDLRIVFIRLIEKLKEIKLIAKTLQNVIKQLINN